MTSVCFLCSANAGKTATGTRSGSGTLPLLFEVTALEFVINGHSLSPLGRPVRAELCDVVGDGGAGRFTLCFYEFGLVQQSCE